MQEFAEADFITQIDLKYAYQTVQWSTKEYALFSAPHWTVSKAGHTLEHKAGLNKNKKF